MSAGQVLVASLFAVALGLFGAVEIAARREGSRVPSLGDVCAVVMRYRVGPLQHPDCRVAARLDPGQARAGLSVRIDEAHHYDLEVAEGHAAVVARIGPARQVLARTPVPAGPITLELGFRASPGRESAAVGPDTVTFRAGEAHLADLDGRYLSTEVAAGFTGRVIGMYAVEGTASFDWFDYHPC